MAYTASPSNIMWGLGFFVARQSGPSVSDPAGLLPDHWWVAIQFGPWMWRKIF